MAKLSKGVLGLKFMRKTKDQLDQKTTEQKHRQIFGGGQDEVKSESDTTSKPQSKIMTCPSYLHCERYNYARQSYGGMNPLVEESVRKGHWKMEYEFSEPGDEDSSAVDDETVPVKNEKNSDDSDSVSNSDDDGPVVGSIIGTIGKRFNKKFKKAFKRPHDDFQEAMDDVSATAPAPKRNKTFQPWKKNSGKYQVNEDL